MSDTMLFGVLRMPYEMAMSDELSRRQFYARAQEAADRIEQQAAAPVVAAWTDEEIIKVAQSIYEPGDAVPESWGVCFGYTEDENGEYTVPRVPAIAVKFARALLAAPLRAEKQQLGDSSRRAGDIGAPDGWPQGCRYPLCACVVNLQTGTGCQP